MVAAAIRTIFAQPDAEHVCEQLATIAAMLGRQFPKVEIMLRDVGPDITAFAYHGTSTEIPMLTEATEDQRRAFQLLGTAIPLKAA